MANLQKVDVPIALGNKTKLDLSTDHVTTGNFGVVAPVYYRQMIKGESINLTALCTARLAPLAVPTYGRMRINVRCMFVPYYQVFPQWDSFYTDTIGANASNASLVTKSPAVTVGTLYDFFVTTQINIGSGTLFRLTENLGTTDPTTLDPPTYYDFFDGTNYYKFTTVGRRVYKLFRSLGYKWPWTKNASKKLSALSILCWAKCYLDWFTNSAFLDSSEILALRKLLSYNDPTGQLVLSVSDLTNIAGLLYAVCYDGDYFVSAWQNPIGPVNSQASIFQIVDPTNNAVSNGASAAQLITNSPSGASSPSYSQWKPTNGTPFVGNGQSSSQTIVPGVFTQFVDTALHRLTDFCKRNALAGNHEIDRYLARFGIAGQSVQKNRSIYVGGKSIDINVGDVMSTANTASAGESSTLGDYAGQGHAQDSKSWQFTADDFGLLLVVYSILPSGGYYQGIDRNNLHLDKFDFFVPEADGLSVQSINKGEIYISDDATYGTPADYDGHFGFTGRYAEYKRPIAWCTGDVSLPSIMAGGDSWNLFRKFDDNSFGSIANQVHSLDFTRFIDFDSYNRIFQYTGSDVDKFYLNFHFDVGSYAPCRPLFDTYDFEDDEKKIRLDSSGSKLN